jgi:hypothetical protein
VNIRKNQADFTHCHMAIHSGKSSLILILLSCHEMVNCHEMSSYKLPQCAFCHTLLTHFQSGRPRRYCSDKCRKAAQRARERNRTDQPVRPTKSGKACIVPCTIAEANAFVARIHRHHGKIPLARFALAVADKSGLIRGVAIVGRPCNTHLDDGWTLEVRRLATDGYKNACSMLLGACWKAAQAIGYRKLITYTLQSESGASLRAVGWTCIKDCGGKPWNSKNRKRTDTPLTLEKKNRWEISLDTPPPQARKSPP